MKWLLNKRFAANIILLIIGAGIVFFYTLCGDSCAYLQGTIFGIELQYLGIVYVLILIFFNILKNGLIVLVLLSAGIGVEVFLIGYQVMNSTYCSYCLVFAALIFFQFILNLDWSRKLLILVFMVLGFFCFFIFFEGSAFPVYSRTINVLVQTVPAIKTV